MPYYLVKLRNTKCSSDSPVVMVSFVVLHICGLNSSSHLPNYLKGCIQYVKLPLLWGLEKVKVGSLYPQFFLEADFLTQTCYFSPLVEVTCHHTKAPTIYASPPTPPQKKKKKKKETQGIF